MKIDYSKTGVMRLVGITTVEEFAKIAEVLNNHADYIEKIESAKIDEAIEAAKTDVKTMIENEEKEALAAMKTLINYCAKHSCDCCRFAGARTECRLCSRIPGSWNSEW